MLETVLSSADIKMPSSLFCDIDNGRSTGPGVPSHSYEEQRALQLAFELMGMNDGSANSSSVVDSDASIIPSNFVVPDESRSKKSQNMTECVPVPSSEHVAEIVGRQAAVIQPVSLSIPLSKRSWSATLQEGLPWKNKEIWILLDSSHFTRPSPPLFANNDQVLHASSLSSMKDVQIVCLWPDDKV
ncbi:hypothetical protein LSTR_LSTR012102 [Laodelphax striatellus]|uniref:Uncharacterized protein n=1 Tax=Laodelphax striatellus TaxID=195883 RepID=A0A482WEU0_LAOST|nr:hypothetical protein LSTR_LSTR012102 [Laodelphax striatellus]